ncbi:MAG: DsbA family protein [Pseudomonadota bacterium]
MSSSVDVYFSFRSPYSYLVTPDLRRLRSDFDLDIHLRPVLPLAVRRPDFFSPENIKRARYIMVDWPRRAEFLGMACHWPNPDPIVQDMETFTIAKDQPYIHRLTELGVEAERRGKGIDFAYEVSHVLFGGTNNWHEGPHLAEAADRAGLNLGEMEATRDGGDHQSEIEANQEALAEADHWGVPTLVFSGEPFFGQDRIETLRWRLEKSGIAKRSA